MTETATATPAFRGKVPAAHLGRYILAFLLPPLAAALFLGALYLFLVQVGETTGPIAAAHRQAETGEKYGAALVYRPFAFKLERYRAIKPDVLIVGSSRVMAFAGEAFNTSMYNSGGGANTLAQAVAFIRAARDIHKPKTILFGLDFWWFNPNREEEIDTTTQDSDTIKLSLSQIIRPIEWMASGHVSAKQFVTTLFKSHQPGIGALAQFYGQGWDRHGRYDYGQLFDGRMKSEDMQFERTLERVRKAKPNSKLSVRVAPSETAILDLKNLIDEVRADGIEIILLLPPIAPRVFAELTRDPEQALIPVWTKAMYRMGVPVGDAHQISSLELNPCEFIDGFHGGEVTYLRILKWIAESSAIASSTPLIFPQTVDRHLVQRLIDINGGHARIGELRPPDAAPEIDFLQLGCTKQADLN